MPLIKLLVAPIRRVVNFPLFQLAVAIVVIVLLQAADSRSVFGKIFSALDLLVDLTVRLCAATFEVKSFTKSWLTTGFMIAYVYIAGLLLIFLTKAALRAAVELVARSNVFGLRNAIARERGIEAYRAWLPLERIRPAHIAQEKWEERFAWPADGKPPIPTAHTSGGARRSHLLGRSADCRRSPASVHAFPCADLAWRKGKTAAAGLSCPAKEQRALPLIRVRWVGGT